MFEEYSNAELKKMAADFVECKECNACSCNGIVCPFEGKRAIDFIAELAKRIP